MRNCEKHREEIILEYSVAQLIYDGKSTAYISQEYFLCIKIQRK